eukprot:11113-Heterococcus_DN1.PRE.2
MALSSGANKSSSSSSSSSSRSTKALAAGALHFFTMSYVVVHCSAVCTCLCSAANVLAARAYYISKHRALHCC